MRISKENYLPMKLQATEKYIELVTTALSKQYGVKIIKSKDWKLDVKHKRLYYDSLDLKQLPFPLVRSLLLHEIGHLKYTEETQRTKLQKEKPAMQDGYNCFEDMRIDNKMKKEYGDFAGGALKILDEVSVGPTIENLRKSSKLHQMLKLSILDRNHQNTYMNHESRRRLDDFFFSEKEEEPLSVYPEVKKCFKKHRDEIQNIMDDCIGAENCEELKKIIDEKYYPIVSHLIDPPTQEKDQSGGSSGGGKSQQGGDKNPPPSGSGNPPPKGGKQPPPQEESEIKKKVRELLKAVQNGGGNETNSIRREAFNNEIEVNAILYPYISVMAERLKSILKERATVRHYGNYKRGKLLGKNAYKVAIREKRMFSKRNNPDTPDYTVSIVLDSSGSMNGTKAIYSFMGACLIRDVVKKLSFKVNFYHFDENFGKLNNINEYKKRIGGDTQDIHALESLEKELKADEDNLIFIFTDGYSEGDPSQIIKKILNKKNATLIGICFGNKSMALSNRYPDYILVDKPEELPKALLAKLRQLIKR